MAISGLSKLNDVERKATLNHTKIKITVKVATLDLQHSPIRKGKNRIHPFHGIRKVSAGPTINILRSPSGSNGYQEREAIRYRFISIVKYSDIVSTVVTRGTYSLLHCIFFSRGFSGIGAFHILLRKSCESVST